MHTSVLIPTYNERESISLALWLLHEHLSAHFREAGPHRPDPPGMLWEVVVVDDGSPDGTADVVRALQRSQHPLAQHIKLVTRPGKLGLGTAYMAGLQQATGEWVVLMDADLSHHPRHIPQFLRCQAATGCDLVCGTRYKRGGGVAGWGFSRKLTSRGANLLASTLLGATTSDLTGAFRLYRRQHLEKLLQLTTCRGYAFQMEVAVRAQYLRLHIEEHPIVFVDRLFGTSKLGASEFLGFLKGLALLLASL